MSHFFADKYPNEIFIFPLLPSPGHVCIHTVNTNALYSSAARLKREAGEGKKSRLLINCSMVWNNRLNGARLLPSRRHLRADLDQSSPLERIGDARAAFSCVYPGLSTFAVKAIMSLIMKTVGFDNACAVRPLSTECIRDLYMLMRACTLRLFSLWWVSGF